MRKKSPPSRPAPAPVTLILDAAPPTTLELIKTYMADPASPEGLEAFALLREKPKFRAADEAESHRLIEREAGFFMRPTKAQVDAAEKATDELTGHLDVLIQGEPAVTAETSQAAEDQLKLAPMWGLDTDPAEAEWPESRRTFTPAPPHVVAAMSDEDLEYYWYTSGHADPNNRPIRAVYMDELEKRPAYAGWTREQISTYVNVKSEWQRHIKDVPFPPLVAFRPQPAAKPDPKPPVTPKSPVQAQPTLVAPRKMDDFYKWVQIFDPDDHELLDEDFFASTTKIYEDAFEPWAAKNCRYIPSLDMFSKWMNRAVRMDEAFPWVPARTGTERGFKYLPVD